MALSGGTLCVLTRDRYGATPLPELRRFAPETLAPTDTLPCETNLTGLGLAADGRLLCGSSKSIDAETAELTAAEVLVSWQEQGLKNTASQLFQPEFGFALYSPDDTELAILRRVPGPAPEKTVLTLAIAAGDAMMPQFTTMIEDFNRSQGKFRVDYEIYSDSNYTDYAPADQLRTQITAGQAPDLYAFYMAGFNAPPLAAEDVGADLLPLLGREFTADSLLPNLYDLLTEDGKLYQLPLTVEVDTLIGPVEPVSRVWRHALRSGGSKAADAGGLGGRSTHGNTPATSSRSARPTASGRMWTKPLRRAILRRRASTIFLPGAARGAGDGSTPAERERTLVTLSWTNSIGQLAGRSNAAKEYWFGTPDYTYIGYPTTDGSVGSGYRVLSSLGVSPQCRDLDGAKAFLTFCFSYLQEDMLPANTELLRSELEAYRAGERTDWRGNVQELSQTDADQFCALLDETTVLEGLDPALEEILQEEAAVYFAGGCSVGQAAENIQSRASLYLQEQYP